MPSNREIFLQNRLALCATLLYETTQVISGKSRPNLPTLILECELFFSETKSLLAAELAAEAEALRISAQAAAKYGVKSASTGWTGWQREFLAETVEILQASAEPPEVSSNPSVGGTTEMDPHWRANLIKRIQASLNTKPGSTSNGSSDPK